MKPYARPTWDNRQGRAPHTKETQYMDADLLSLFKKELELCKVREGEVLAVLSAGNERPKYAQAFLVAAQGLGATAFHVNVARTQPIVSGVQGRHPLAGNQPAIDTLKRADIVI